eukprot:Opistho-2@71537
MSVAEFDVSALPRDALNFIIQYVDAHTLRLVCRTWRDAIDAKSDYWHNRYCDSYGDITAVTAILRDAGCAPSVSFGGGDPLGECLGWTQTSDENGVVWMRRYAARVALTDEDLTRLSAHAKDCFKTAEALLHECRQMHQNAQEQQGSGNHADCEMPDAEGAGTHPEQSGQGRVAPPAAGAADVEKKIDAACSLLLKVLTILPEHRPTFFLLAFVCHVLAAEEETLQIIEMMDAIEADDGEDKSMQRSIEELRKEVTRLVQTQEETEEHAALLDDGRRSLSNAVRGVLGRIFDRFDRDTDGILSMSEFSEYVFRTNGQRIGPPQFRYFLSNFPSTKKGLTKAGFLEFYLRQTLEDPEETWKDLKSHGYNRFLVPETPGSA